MATEILLVGLHAPARLLPELREFYGTRLGVTVIDSEPTRLALAVGESVLELRASPGEPFYHVALLVPGNRFEAALAWVGAVVELLPDPATGDVVFDFENWVAEACYFHDPAGNIVELIAHRGVGERNVYGAFTAAELIGVSEVGLVCDPPLVASALGRMLGLEVWSGSVAEPGRLAFVGEKARTLILAGAGRPWLPTGRPAEEHPVDVALAGTSDGEVRLDDGGRVRRCASEHTSSVSVRAS